MATTKTENTHGIAWQQKWQETHFICPCHLLLAEEWYT